MDFSNIKTNNKSKIFVKKSSRKIVFWRLFFLFYPINVFKFQTYLLIFASLIALGVILSYISVPILNVGIKVSFTWFPTIIAGWFFGPIIGLGMGFIIDTLCFLFHGGIWFWLYAIQEPLVGFIAGCIGVISYIINNVFENKKRFINFLVFEIFLNFFCLFTVLFILIIANTNFNLIEIINNKQNLTEFPIFTLIIISITIMVVFYILIQIIGIIKYKNFDNSSNFYFIAIISIIVTFIFSFLLGPISAVEYYKFLNKKEPSNFIKYGYFYYLIPRIIKEMFKTPLYIFGLCMVSSALNFIIKDINNKILNTWEYTKSITYISFKKNKKKLKKYKKLLNQYKKNLKYMLKNFNFKNKQYLDFYNKSLLLYKKYKKIYKQKMKFYKE